MSYYSSYPEYVSVADRQANAERQMAKRRKQGKPVFPVETQGRTISSSFWGKAWNKHLENFSDYATRLPRGRTYVNNGSVCHLDIQEGKVEAFVGGTEVYEVSVSIKRLGAKTWEQVRKKCAGQIGSILELLQGKLSSSVMEIVTDKRDGLFPGSREIDFDCDCPDGAYMCKHVAAVLYGVGARLDAGPELLFLLRGVDHEELVSGELQLPTASGGRRKVKGELGAIFGIELDQGEVVPVKAAKKKKVVKKKVKAAKKKKVRK